MFYYGELGVGFVCSVHTGTAETPMNLTPFIKRAYKRVQCILLCPEVNRNINGVYVTARC